MKEKVKKLEKGGEEKMDTGRVIATRIRILKEVKERVKKLETAGNVWIYYRTTPPNAGRPADGPNPARPPCIWRCGLV